ncbi:nucleoside diphosphate kinase 6-like isoform X3 [Photinus pyralis]|uniref:nucleoside diphosphate kinase 6-like isoform X3 n=1 Tax=Photinus pyralis TaxID=7054 RepID=UPI00126772E9|nr:nucleoside diphosphate kinase 6-like isoform X3 [Photinus pyralis]
MYQLQTDPAANALVRSRTQTSDVMCSYSFEKALIRSGPSDLYILARENAIQEWRDLMGPTKTYKAQYEDPDTIRGEFGLSDTRNATHGSDSVESATREMKLLFPEFNVLKWQENEEFYFRSNSLIFCCFDFVHKVNYK